MPAPKVALRQIDELKPDPRNARTHSEDQVGQLVASINRFGWTNPVLADDLVRAGHGRIMAAKAIYADGGTIYLAPGKERGGKAITKGAVPVIDCTGWTEEERKAYALADNQLALQAGWDTEILMSQLEELQAADFDLPTIGFDQAALDALAGLGEIGPTGGAAGKSGAGALAEEFLIAPFTVMSARDGWWMNRKRSWLALGIKSEVGRGENLLGMSDTMLEPDPEKRAAMQAAREAGKGKARTFGQDLMRGEHEVGDGKKGKKKGLGGVTMDALSSHPRYYEQKTAAEAKVGRKLTPEEFERDHWVLPDSDLSSGTSIFDPVLCELSYRWFSPPGGRILDPFAGGSVRGIVAAVLGRQYVGVDLRPEQIEANVAQWPEVRDRASAGRSIWPLAPRPKATEPSRWSRPGEQAHHLRRRPAMAAPGLPALLNRCQPARRGRVGVRDRGMAGVLYRGAGRDIRRAGRWVPGRDLRHRPQGRRPLAFEGRSDHPARRGGWRSAALAQDRAAPGRGKDRHSPARLLALAGVRRRWGAPGQGDARCL